MGVSGLLNWPEGAGWLILSGGNSAAGMVRASVLIHAGPGPIAYLCTSGNLSAAHNALEDMESLGAPSGYVVDTTIEDEETTYELLTEAGIIVLGHAVSPSIMVDNLRGSLDQVLGDAHEKGAFLLAEGASATAFGSWLTEEDELLPALAWLEGVLITTGMEEPLEASPLTDLNLHIPDESALALGPNGAIELWGKQDVRITLGSEYLTG